jgi:hypothetical protein
MFIRGCILWCLLIPTFSCALAQNALPPDSATQTTATQTTAALPPPSLSEKWNLFVSETVTPLTLADATPNAIASQLARFAPLYGKRFWRRDAFLKRLGATVADEASENFFSDFVLASALHEDTRYIRRGPSHKIWPRIGYAISRAVVARTDSGDATFNWARVVGSAMSAGLSNAYYPPASRTASVSSLNWGTNIAGAGLANLMPEFKSDVGHWMKRHLRFLH